MPDLLPGARQAQTAAPPERSQHATFKIGDRTVGSGAPCLLIAEMGLGHDGSLGAAHAFVDAVAAAGADAVKFQTHIAEAESTAAEQFRARVFVQDATRRDYWKRTAFNEEQWKGLQKHADERGLLFLSSPFSVEAVRLLTRVGVPAWKVASGEVTSLPMLAEMAETRRPFLLSSGMSRMEELDRAVAFIRERGLPLVLFQCTNRYPCPPEHAGLNLLAEYRARYGAPVGFSDHSGTVAAGLAAVALGACAVEVHVTFSRHCFGPDVSSSLTVEELATLAGGIRYVERALAAPVDKDAEAGQLGEIRAMFMKGIVAARALARGARLTAADLGFKKPATGIPVASLPDVVGKTLRRDVAADESITWRDLADD
jgi:N-acetylneuraminate synthase